MSFSKRSVSVLLVLSAVLSLCVVFVTIMYADDYTWEWHECKIADGCKETGCFLRKPDGQYFDCELTKCGTSGFSLDCRKQQN
jgi:hypothetical protein